MARLRMVLDGARAIAAARLLGRWTPLTVSWALTTRCNLRCRGCAWPSAPVPELDTAGVVTRIRELAAVGTRAVSFTGGEPLLRDDLEAILAAARAAGLVTSLNTNGALLKRRTGVLPLLDRLAVSIDGPEAVHDAVRGKGSFAAAVEAVGIARSRGVETVVGAVLSRQAVERVEELLEVARSLGVRLVVQPPTLHRLGPGDAPNPIAPDAARYADAMRRLIAFRRGPDGRRLLNSLPGLEYLSAWPEGAPIYCSSKRLVMRLGPDGSVMACGASPGETPVPCPPGSLRAVMPDVPRIPCTQCWCASMVEINLCAAFRPGALLNAVSMARGAWSPSRSQSRESRRRTR